MSDNVRSYLDQRGSREPLTEDDVDEFRSTGGNDFGVQVSLQRKLERHKANKYEASLGLRSRAGRLFYGVAVTENLGNYQNTPDIGLTLTLGWVGGQGSVRVR